MKWNYAVSSFLMFFIFFIVWYYAVCFLGVMKYSGEQWAVCGVISFLLEMIVWPMLQVIALVILRAVGSKRE